jgi:hypothetical protein
LPRRHCKVNVPGALLLLSLGATMAVTLLFLPTMLRALMREG